MSSNNIFIGHQPGIVTITCPRCEEEREEHVSSTKMAHRRTPCLDCVTEMFREALDEAYDE